VVGFREHGGSGTTFPTAVRSFVALRHVDRPLPWGAGPESEALADEVVDELARRELLSETEKAYFAGSCTRAEAIAAHLSDDPAVRACLIVRTFSTSDPSTDHAIRVAVTSQRTRKRISSKLRDELATALILRALAEEPAKTDQIRRYLKDAYGKAAHREPWQATNRSADTLVSLALDELEVWFGNGLAGDPGPASLELAVRAAYPLVVGGALNSDRGTANNPQPDRRLPGEVLDVMRRSPQGIRQLGQALIDFGKGPIRRVDSKGQVQCSPEGATLYANDIYLRNEYPANGKARTPLTDDSPEDHLQAKVFELGESLELLWSKFQAVQEVQGCDGLSLVEDFGVSSDLCLAWQDKLREIEQELVIWDRTFRRKHGRRATSRVIEIEADDDDGYEKSDDQEEEED
jgi:hypothetical protein